MHINIRSLRNKLSYLESIIDDIDILYVTKSHLDPSISNADIKLDGFNHNPFRKDRNTFGGGVVLYFSNSLVVKRRTDLEFDNDETIWAQVIFKNTTYIIGTMYRPTWANRASGVWQRLKHFLDLAFEITNKVILTGVHKH